jgi:hypothetical protein
VAPTTSAPTVSAAPTSAKSCSTPRVRCIYIVVWTEYSFLIPSCCFINFCVLC